MNKDRKIKNASGARSNRKKKILKVGGLWIDPMSFPAFDNK